MGTRVDFYVGRGETAEWLGSYPFDGYPSGVFDRNELLPGDEQGWRDWVTRFLAHNADRATLPEQGWPWPWEDSATTESTAARKKLDELMWRGSDGKRLNTRLHDDEITVTYRELADVLYLIPDAEQAPF